MSNVTPPTAALRVLVVDDNPDAAESLALLLALDGHTVHTCGDGQQTLLALQTFAPAAVLLDIGLPDMSGYELAALLRATPNGAALLLIAITGWGLDVSARPQQAAFDHHMAKPVSPDALRRLLATAAPR